MAKKKIDTHKEIGSTLTRLMADHPILNTQSALASASGVGQTTIGRIMRSEVNPTADILRKLAKSLGVDTAVFFSGTEAEVNMRPILTWEHEDDLPEGEFALIRRFGVELSAGNGHESIEIVMDEKQPQAFRADWIRKKGLKPVHLACMTADGSSMESRIQDGDALVIDTSQKDVVDGTVFGLWYDGGARVKRLYRLPGGGLRIKSDNPEFMPIDLQPGQLEHVHIIGRVVHVAGEGGL
jgi:phage repressor protein C with HTH and peptisase S24 domain